MVYKKVNSVSVKVSHCNCFCDKVRVDVKKNVHSFVYEANWARPQTETTVLTAIIVIIIIVKIIVMAAPGVQSNDNSYFFFYIL